MKKNIFSIALLSIAAAGCSSDSDNTNYSDPLANKLVITGKVSDPAVKGAKVDLYGKDGSILMNCGVNSNTRCNVWSYDDGTFKFVLPLGTDYSSYTMKTTSGIDSEYGYELEYSLSKKLVKNEQNIIISPVTSLLNELELLGVNDPKKLVSGLFKIPVKELNQDPEINTRILKASYILNSMITINSQDKVINIKQIAEALKNSNGNEQAVLNYLYNKDDKTKKNIQAVITSMKSIAETDVKQAIAVIKKTEKQRMFEKNIMELTSQTTLSDLAKNNIKTLINKIEKRLKTDIPLDEFMVGQLVKYIALLNNKVLSTYQAYNVDANTFSATLTAAIQSSPLFDKEITSIISEKVNNINVPLREPLGLVNNQKRLDYYFNSTQDINYKARQLTKLVLKDEVNENIYTDIINNYAAYGFLDKAEKYANTYMKNILRRIQILAEITNSASNMYDSNKNIRSYVDKAHKDMQAYIAERDQITSSYVSTYITILRSYSAIKDLKKIDEVKTELFNSLDNYQEGSQSGQTPLFKLYRHTYTSLGNIDRDSLIFQVLDSGNIDGAFKLLQIRKEAVDRAYKATLASKKPFYRPTIMGYKEQLAIIVGFYSYDKGNKYLKEVKEMVYSIENSLLDLKQQTMNLDERTKYEHVGAFVYLADALNYVASDETEALKIYDMIKPEEVNDQSVKDSVTSYKKSTAAAIFRGKALKDGFNNAKAFFEKYIKMDQDKANLIDDYLRYFVGIGRYPDTEGFVYVALDYNKKADAEKALEFMYNEFKNLSQMEKLPHELLSKLYAYNVSNIDFPDDKYEVSGVTALARGYYETGNKAKALEVLQFGDKFLTAVPDSVAKQDSYMALARMAKFLGDNNLAKKYYQAGITVQYPAPDGKTGYYPSALMALLKAYDAYYLDMEDKFEVAKKYLPEAAKFTSQIAENEFQKEGKVTAKEKFYEARSYLYALIAESYFNANMIKEAKETLLTSEKEGIAMPNGDTKGRFLSRLMEAYANCELINEGYEKAVELGVDDTNKYNLIERLVLYVTRKNDFPTSHIARIDTDKDGKPDFVYPWVTQEDMKKANLVLDDDIDGDNVKDDKDLLPYIQGNI